MAKKSSPTRAPRDLRAAIREQLDLGNFEWIPESPDCSMSSYDDGYYCLIRLPDGWVLGLRLLPRRGVFEVMEAIFLAVDEDGTGGLTTGLFRDVPFGEIVRNARAKAADLHEFVGDEAAARAADFMGQWRTSARGSQRKRSDVAYAALAARYAELVRAGDRSPAATLAVELGVSAITVSQRVREARERKLLTHTPPGTAGGELTEKAISVLTNPVFNALADETEA